MTGEFVLIDDMRGGSAGSCFLYSDPVDRIVARHGHDVAAALNRVARAQANGQFVAGYLAYEAGLALEPRLMPRLAARTGAGGPLVWFGVFNGRRTIGSLDVSAWLDEISGHGHGAIGPWHSAPDWPEYQAMFDRVHEAIHAGDIYQANLTIRQSARWAGHPAAIYRALRGPAGGGNGALIFDGSHWLASLSPETFFSLSGDEIVAVPMKGTAMRSADAQTDARRKQELANSGKDRAENLMIVDLMRNDLSRVSLPGSVKVPDLYQVESYPTVHQMVSRVTARLKPGFGAADVLRATFPAGSITGAPKIRAMEIIDDLETGPRGPYCGSIGHITPDGQAAFNVAIRTLRLDPDTKMVEMGLGSAIVAESTARSEWLECQSKGVFARMGAPRYDLFETMAFDPAAGIALLEGHLARMKASAAELGFSFDRHEARNAIHAICFHSDEASRVRLMLGPSGALAIEIDPMPEPLSAPLPVALVVCDTDPSDIRLRHKTTDRRIYDEALAQAKGRGAAEAVLVGQDGFVTEGSFTSLFLERDGKLVTPPLSRGLLPGVLRAQMIEDGKAVEGDIRAEEIEAGGALFVGNALRGLMPARLVTD